MSEKSSHQNDSISNYFFDAQSTTPIDETVLKVINTVFRNKACNDLICPHLLLIYA